MTHVILCINETLPQTVYRMHFIDIIYDIDIDIDVLPTYILLFIHICIGPCLSTGNRCIVKGDFLVHFKKKNIYIYMHRSYTTFAGFRQALWTSASHLQMPLIGTRQIFHGPTSQWLLWTQHLAVSGRGAGPGSRIGRVTCATNGVTGWFFFETPFEA